MSNIKKVDIYTDGACKSNPGPGGYGVILMYNGREKELSGGEKNTTNNRMELTAAIKGLEALNERCEVTLYSDSRYLVDAMEKNWASGWKKKGWKRSNGDKALNPDLWERLLTLTMEHNVRFVWVKGHDENVYNNRCDEMASGQAKLYAAGEGVE